MVVSDKNKRNKLLFKRREKYKKDGFCSSCRQKASKFLKQCLYHWLCARSYHLFKTRLRWQELWELLKSQNFLCTYSGKFLIAGINASVEHRIPLSKGGTNDISNLHWVDRNINTFKGALDEDDFLKTVKMIYEKMELNKLKL